MIHSASMLWTTLLAQAPILSGQSAQPAQQPAENPLDKLRDIHLPKEIDQFPAAYGWWILVALIVIVLAFFLYRELKYRKAIRLIKPARIEIEQLRSLPEKQINASAIANLSGLIKRVCLIYFPEPQVASLNGKNWLTFLNQQCPISESRQVFFTAQQITLFTTAAYQENPKISSQQWHQLLLSSEQCIESIIKTAAKRKKNNQQTNKPNALMQRSVG